MSGVSKNIFPSLSWLLKISWNLVSDFAVGRLRSFDNKIERSWWRFNSGLKSSFAIKSLWFIKGL